MLTHLLLSLYSLYLFPSPSVSAEKNASLISAIKDCNLRKDILFLRELTGILFSDESDDKVDYHFSVCGFRMNDNSSLTINQSLIAVGDDEVTEIGSFINFKLAYEDNRYVIRFNDSGNLAELILGCGSAIAFHLVSHEGEESYIFDLFHPSLCGIHQSVLYTLIVILICCSVLIVGYCILSCLLKRCLYRRSWYESIPYIDTFENLNNRLKDYIVLHCHRRQTHLIEPVYMPVPSDSPDHGTNKKHGSLYDDLVEQKQKLLLSNSSDEQQDDILLAL